MLRVTKRKHHKILTRWTFLRFVTFTFWNFYVLKFLRLETITFSDATLSDINIVLRFVAVPHGMHGHYSRRPMAALDYNIATKQLKALD
jgi:hypothetical protein